MPPIKYSRRLAAALMASIMCAVTVQKVLAQNSPDPVLSYSTFLGGGAPDKYGENGYSVAMGPGGFVYVVGVTDSATDFPFTVRLGPQAVQGTFVAKFDPVAKSFVYITLIPWCFGEAIAVDSAGNAYVAGHTDYVLSTTNALQTVFGGGDFDAFVAELSADGAHLIYATFLGGSGNDLARQIAVDSNGQVIVAGLTDSADFPITTNGVAQPHLAGGYDAFVVKLGRNGTNLLYSTYLGGSADDFGTGLAVDGSGNIYVSGQTDSTNFATAANFTQLGTNGASRAFVAKLAADFSAVRYLTFIGDGTSPDAPGDEANSIVAAVAVDSAGSAYLFGQTSATNFPVTPNAPQHQYGGGNWDDFVAKLDDTGSRLSYCTYLGGSYSEDLTEPIYADNGYLYLPRAGLAVDDSGDVYVAGQTRSRDALAGTAPANLRTGEYAAYVAKYDPTGSTNLYFRYLGNADDLGAVAMGLAYAGNSNIFITGSTGLSVNVPYFPTTPDAFQPAYAGGVSDGFLTEFSEAAPLSANDGFTDRISLAGSRLTVQANNQDATAEPGEPNHAGFPASHSLWWTWTARKNGQLQVTTGGSGFDTVLAVYTNQTLTTLMCVASNDDASADIQTSSVRFPVVAGTPYQIAVDGKEGATGSISLNLTLSAPPNDDFSNRITLNGFPIIDILGSNVDATTEPGETLDYGTDRSVWWTWTCTIDADIEITAVDTFQTELEVYTNDSLASLVAIDTGSYSTNTLVPLKAAAGTTYQIAVRGVDGASGDITLSILPTAPPANDDFSSSALLSGALVHTTNYNVTATTQPGEPSVGFPSPAGRTLWWSWIAPSDGWLRLGTAGSDFNTRLGVFTGTDLTNLTLVTAYDDEDPYFQTRVDFPVLSGTLYHVVVDGSQSDPAGNIELFLFFYHPPTIIASSVGGLPNGPFHHDFLSV